VVPTATKLEFLKLLASAGCQDIELTSFVRPQWVPQLADARELLALAMQEPMLEGVRLWGLVPNEVGLERAQEGGLNCVATVLSASETHNKKNLNRTIRESLAGLVAVIETAVASDLKVRAYISTVFGCPYEGDVPLTASLALAEKLLAAGASEIALGDTVGMGNPRQVEAAVALFEKNGIGVEKLAIHLHDTRGTALANALTAYQCGIRTIDGSVAGLGGCPYAPGASGNAATEDMVQMFEAMGVSTGISLEKLAEAGLFMENVLQRGLPGRYHQYFRGARERALRAAG
jgi:hydroxymethylglutaryl-CoA lyase